MGRVLSRPRASAPTAMWLALCILAVIGAVNAQCSTLLDALQRENPPFAALVRAMQPPGVPGEVYNIMNNPDATNTLLSPLPQDANGLLYSFQNRGDINRDEVYNIVSMHLLRATVSGSTLRANPVGTPHETFNEDEDVNVGPEGSIAGTSGGSNTTVLLETDLEPCAPNAVLHSIRSLLKPVDFVLPDSAAPRAITQDDTPALGASAEAPSGGGGGNNDTIIYASSGACAVVFLLLLCLITVLVKRRRNERKREKEAEAARKRAEQIPVMPRIHRHGAFPPHPGMYNPHGHPQQQLIPAHGHGPAVNGHASMHGQHARNSGANPSVNASGRGSGPAGAAGAAGVDAADPCMYGSSGEAGGMLPVASASTGGGFAAVGGTHESLPPALDSSFYESGGSAPHAQQAQHADGNARRGTAQTPPMPFGVYTVQPPAEARSGGTDGASRGGSAHRSGDGTGGSLGGRRGSNGQTPAAEGGEADPLEPGQFASDRESSGKKSHRRSGSHQRSQSRPQVDSSARGTDSNSQRSGTGTGTGTAKSGNQSNKSHSRNEAPSPNDGNMSTGRDSAKNALGRPVDSLSSFAKGSAPPPQADGRLKRSVAMHQRTRVVPGTGDLEAPSTYVGPQEDSEGLARAHALQPPSERASPDERKIWLDHQLDTLAGRTLLRQFVLLGPDQRRYGGQAIVQFARSAADGCQRTYALKFFLKQKDFESEKAFYRNSPIGKLLPMLAGLVEDGELKDLDDHALPPCIIMERGESLNEWCKRRKPDIWGVMPILANVAKRLEAMHDAGYVHRDLKPANVMWLPRENLWTLIDFGCAAKTASKASISFTLGYAAPETILALNRRAPYVIANPAADAWALGVMMFELLTGHKAFDGICDGHTAVMAMLAGERPLPWERLQSSDKKRLGEFRKPIMQLLNRNPDQRPSLSQFYDSCNAIFFSNTTTKLGEALDASYGGGAVGGRPLPSPGPSPPEGTSPVTSMITRDHEGIEEGGYSASRETTRVSESPEGTSTSNAASTRPGSHPPSTSAAPAPDTTAQPAPATRDGMGPSAHAPAPSSFPVTHMSTGSIPTKRIAAASAAHDAAAGGDAAAAADAAAARCGSSSIGGGAFGAPTSGSADASPTAVPARSAASGTVTTITSKRQAGGTWGTQRSRPSDTEQGTVRVEFMDALEDTEIATLPLDDNLKIV